MKLVKHTQNFQLQASENSTHVENFDGKQWLVAPAVALVEGVLNDLLVPAREIEISTLAWNGRFIPLYHPEDGDGSAGTPQVIESSVMGYFFNAHFENNSLKGEIWLDIQKTQGMGDLAVGVLNDIEQGNLVELSTGYYCLVTQQAGNFNGQPYSGITSHILPDHIALLPGQVGACSVADGCGVPRLNQQERSEFMANFKAITAGSGKDLTRFHFEANEFSHDDIKQLLRQSLKASAQMPGAWVYIPDVYDDRVVYELEVETANGYQSDLLQRPYTINEAGEITLGEPIQRVAPVSSYQVIPGEPIVNSSQAAAQQSDPGLLGRIETAVKNVFSKYFPMEASMNKKQKLIQVITNAGLSCMSAEQLEALPEAALEAMATGLQSNDDDGGGGGAGDEPATAQPVAVVPAADGEQPPAWAQTLTEQLGTLADAVAGLQQNQASQVETQRSQLITQLVSNELCPLNDVVDFEGLSLAALEKMANSYQPISYAGLPFGTQNNTGWDEVGLAINVGEPTQQNGGAQ